MVIICFLSASIFNFSDIRKIFAIATLSGLILSIYGILQHFGFDFLRWNISESAGNIALKYRSFATLSSPSFLGLYLAMITPLTLSGSIDSKKNLKPFWYISLASIIICLIFTYSRASWIGASVGTIVYLAFSMSKKEWIKNGKWTLLILVISVIIGFLLSSIGDHPSAISRAISITDSEVGSTQIRFKLWHSALTMTAKRPIAGWGLGTFRYVMARYAPAGMTDLERQNISAHNDFLDRVSQTGLLGILAYLGLIVMIAMVIREALANNDEQNIIFAIMGSLIVYFIALQFGFSSLTPMALWWILIGCLIGLSKKSSLSNSEKPLRSNIIITSLFALVWFFLAVWTFSWLIADIHFGNARIAFNEGYKLKAIENAKKAIKWNPKQDFYLSWLGQAYHEQDKSAFDICSKTIHINPINPANRALMARAYQIAGQDNFALKEWQTAIELDPHWTQAYNELGLAYQRLGDTDSAISSYLNAVSIDSDNASAYNNLGNAYLDKGKIDDAIIAYRRALVRNTGWETAIRNLNKALEIKEKYRK